MSKYRAIPEYYDAEFAHLDILQKDVPFLLKRMPKRRQSVLELAAGTGRVAIPLARAGHQVVGIDYDERVLEIARGKCRAENLRVEFRRGDCLTLNLHRKFDWVICLFNTFLNFTKLEEQDRFLQTVRRHLKPRGHFYLDIFHPDLEMLAAPATWGLDRVEFEVPGRGGRGGGGRTVTRTTDTVRTRDAVTQELTYRYVWKDKKGKGGRTGRGGKQENRFLLTSIFPRELRLLLERNGLRVEKMQGGWGDYDGSSVSADSPRILTLCRRA
jgi:SAM-dependent methyltransferase